MMSFLMILCIYKLELHVEYFSSMHVSRIIYFLEIGTDDIFAVHNH